MNTKTCVNRMNSRIKSTSELKGNVPTLIVKNILTLYLSERDQYEHRIVELDRQITQNELHIQTQTKEKENLLLQVKYIIELK